MVEYVYGMRLRGFSPGCQPKDGLLRREDSKPGERYYDRVVYGRKLTEREVTDYELDFLICYPVGDDAYDAMVAFCDWYDSKDAEQYQPPVQSPDWWRPLFG